MKVSQVLIGAATLALSSMLAFGAPATAAQPTPLTPTAAAPFQGRQQMSPADRAKAMTDRLDQAVKLTADQKTQVSAIYEKAAAAEQAAFSAGGDDAMANFRTIASKATADVKALLTPEQLKKFPAGRGGRRAGGNGGGGGQ